jgi:hypothetical protein
MKLKTTLVTPFYTDKNEDRQKELLTCLEKNIECPEIDQIVLIIDDKTKVKRHKKVKVQYVESRPTYTDMFNIANRYNATGIKIIANTDIYFDFVNIVKIKSSLEEDMCFALSRWDVQADGDIVHHASWDSQDTWIFKGFIKPVSGNFFMGRPGCDNRIAYEIMTAGYKVRNPSRSIRSFHLHVTQVHNYVRNEEQTVKMPYMLLPVTLLDNMTDSYNLMTEVGSSEHGKDKKEYKQTVTEDGEFINTYTYENQVKEIEKMLITRRISKRYTWSIIILTTRHPDKTYKFNQLVRELYRQIHAGGYGKRVQIYPVLDNGKLPIGWKRNKGNIKCQGKYVSHLDDDDWPGQNYIKSVLDAIIKNPGVDCITFNALLTNDGKNPEVMVYHSSFKDNNHYVLTDDVTVRRSRMPSHINVMKREIQLACPFKVYGQPGQSRTERKDFGSDVEQSREIVEKGLIKHSVHINDILYNYKCTSNKVY